ncbi:YcxB-like protein [Bacillus sp. OV322]|uniref:YcxB family protein n=1 Tax=Bacillus sp. OV322 TaxID=1882764 RepID=UPI0008E26A19|nr:YcxB family protein [Bacillus sp. OV322]SFC94906.1 YcxB-like protein [Bacillus sp. OV322]
MKSTYQLDLQDYLNFQMNHAANSPAVKKALLIQRFLFPIIMLALPLFIDSSIFGWIVYTIFAAGWLIFYPKYFYGHIKKNAKKMLQEGDDCSLYGTHELTITDQEIIEKSKNGETRHNWESIQKIVDTPSYFYIYNSNVSGYIIPKSKITQEISVFLQNKKAAI